MLNVPNRLQRELGLARSAAVSTALVAFALSSGALGCATDNGSGGSRNGIAAAGTAAQVPVTAGVTGGTTTAGTGGVPVPMITAGTGVQATAGTPAVAGTGAAGTLGQAGRGMGIAGGTAGTAAAGTGAAGTGAAGTGMAGTGAAGSPPASGDICARWKGDRMNLSEGTWSGDPATCTVGDISKDARDNAYRLHTLYRFMAGLSQVPMTDDNNSKAQACALLMAANGTISHMPDSSWKCYTMDAATTAGSSSLSSGGSVSSVDGYMIDPGNPTTLGHRRWVLSNMLTGVGFGSSLTFSCQYQPAGWGAAGGKPWVAWPPAGQIPIQAMKSLWASIDQTGWSLQSDTINFASAQVAVTNGSMNLPVTVTQLASGYGSTYAIGFIPMGWQTAAGNTYHVKVSGASMPIEYDVQVVDCP